MTEKRVLITRCVKGEKALANVNVQWQEAVRIQLRRKRYCDTIYLEQAKQEALKRYLGHLITEYRKGRKTDGFPE